MAAEASQLQPEAAPQETPKEAPAQETPAPEPAPEHWTKKPFEGGSLGAAEDLAELRGMGNVMGEKASEETQKFDEETKSWWGRAKGRLFRKKEGTPQAELTPAAAKGEAEILMEIEKADATFANFRKEMAQIMASGDEAQLRVLEGNLQRASDQLMEEVGEEGKKMSNEERKAWKQALDGKGQPEMSKTGAQLNYVTKRLADVRAKLNGGTPVKAEAPAAASAPETPAEQPAPAPEATQAEKDLDEDIARGVAEFEAEQAAAKAAQVPPAPVPSLNEVLTGIPDEELAKRWKPTNIEPETPEETPEVPPQKPDFKDADREELMKATAGKPGEKMVDEYLKLRRLTEDAHGTIVGRSFDPLKGEIRLTYEDGSEYRKYSTGTVLRVMPGGLQETVPSLPESKEEALAKRMQEMAARVDASMEKEEAAVGQAPIAGEIESKPAAPEPAPEPTVIVAEEPPQPAAPSREPVLATHLDHLGQDEQGNPTEAETPPQPEAPAPSPEKPNPYDKASLLSLEEDVAGWEEDQAQNPDPKTVERIAQLKDSIARRNTPEGLKAEVANLERYIAKTRKKLDAESPEDAENLFTQFADGEHYARGEGSKKDDYTETLREALANGSDPELTAAFEGYRKKQRQNDEQRLDSFKRQKETLERRLMPPTAAAEEQPAEPVTEPIAEASPEKQEAGLSKLEAKMDAAAAEIIKMMPEEAKSPNTFRAKVGKLPTKKILEAYVASGAVTEAEAKEIDGELKVAGEELNEFRKKLALAAQKKLKG
jgi:hypothetical protein